MSEAFEQVVRRLEETPDLLTSNWCVPRETGRVLGLMARTIHARDICEVGTSIGYSTLWLAQAAQQNEGHVDTLEYSEARQIQARAHLAEAGLSDRVTFHLGQAIPLLEALQAEGRQFDLAFIDAAKREYIDYLRLLTPMLRPGGLLIADNTRSHHAEMLDFLAEMADSPDFDIAELETPNGQLLAHRR